MFDTSIKNKRKTVVIVTIFVTMVAALIYFICYINDIGYAAVPIAMTISIIMSIAAYYNSDKLILTMSNARPATKEQNQRMVENLEGLCIAAGVPMPKLYIVEDSAPNAFATGRNPQNSVICVTTGLLDKLNDYELEGVLAHELSHIRNYDILLQTIVTVFVGFVVIASDFFTRIAFRGGKAVIEKVAETQ
jgi:heat shock protein HtpX